MSISPSCASSPFNNAVLAASLFSMFSMAMRHEQQAVNTHNARRIKKSSQWNDRRTTALAYTRMLTANQASTRNATETWNMGNKVCLSASILDMSATSISVTPSEAAILAAMASLDSDMDINDGGFVVERRWGTLEVISSTGPEVFSGSCVNVDDDGIEWT